MSASSPEEHFAAVLAKMPSTQREAYLAQLPKKDTTKDVVVLPQTVAAVRVTHLPVRAVTSQAPPMRSVVNPQKVSRAQLATETLRAAFGDQIPEV